MEEKRWAQRRTSDVSTALTDPGPPVAGTLKLEGIRESLVPGTAKDTTPFSPFLEDEERVRIGEPQVLSTDLRSCHFIF